jgi:P-type Ca2+ transporter type 2C
MKNFENLTPSELETELQTSLKEGLTTQEAQKRLEENGKNELPKPKVQP